MAFLHRENLFEAVLMERSNADQIDKKDNFAKINAEQASLFKHKAKVRKKLINKPDVTPGV